MNWERSVDDVFFLYRLIIISFRLYINTKQIIKYTNNALYDVRDRPGSLIKKCDVGLNLGAVHGWRWFL